MRPRRACFAIVAVSSLIPASPLVNGCPCGMAMTLPVVRSGAFT